MLKHEFYADPTVFDHWHSHAQDWICARLGKLCPYAWSVTFLAVALICVLVGTAVFSNLLLQALGGTDAMGWNRFVAQALTVLIALTACHTPVALAVKAWPESELPKHLARIAAWCGLPSGSSVRSETGQRSATVATESTGREAVQEFFAEVRAAGVNVRVAKSLFMVGIRSAQQLRKAPDSALLRIYGVGPETLRRLRTRFGDC